MMRLTKRVFSAFLAFVMVFTMLPLDAWAADGTSDNSLVAPLAVPSGPEAVGLELDQSSAVIQIGGTATFVPKVTMNDGTTQEDIECTWVSDHPEVAKVADGVVTGVAEGTATITCKLDNFETFAMVTVTNVNYRLVYESKYPEDAVKYTYQNGGSASIGSATDTTVNETYEIGATATVASGIFTTINYDLVNYLGSDGNTYNVGDTITMNSNLTLTAQWERNGNTTSQEQITVRYYKISNGNPPYVDKTVTATFTSQEDNKATVTFITGNNQDTIVENYQDFYGWTIGGKDYSFNEQVTTTASWRSTGRGEGYWLVEAQPLRAGEEDNVVHAQFFIRKANADGYGEADQYYSVGSGTVDSTNFKREQGDIVSGTVAGSDNVNDNVNSYILTAPSAAQIANLMNITLDEASAVRWYVIKNQEDGFHVDGVIYLKDKYWRVEFVDPDTGKVVQTLLVEDADKIPVDQVISEDRLNNDLRDFTHWVDEKEKTVNLNDLVVTGDIRLTADFTRFSGYKVEYYLQNADDDDYTLDEKRTETHKKEVNQQVSVIPQNIDGYTFKSNGSITSGTVKEGETLVLKLYYDRETYQVTYSYTGEKPAEAPDVPAVETYKWGQTVTPKTVTLPDGSYYVFDGWYKDGVKVDDTFVMPKSPVTLTGSFELNVPDTNVYWLKVNIYAGNQGSGKLIGSREMNNLTWEKLSDYYKMNHYEVANEFWGKMILDSNSELYTHRWTPSKADPAKTTDRGYHELDIYLKENAPAVVTITYDANGGINPPDAYDGVKGDTYSIAQPGDMSYEGYDFVGWNTEEDGSGTAYTAGKEITLESDLTLYAQWTKKVANYTIKYYLDEVETTAPPYEGAPTSGSDQIGNEVKPEFKAEFTDGSTIYKLDNTKGNLSVVITADGENVINVYYYGQYTVTYQWADGTTVPNGAQLPEDEEGPYTKGTDVTVIQPEAVKNYVFNGWTMDGTEVTGSFKMPAKNVTLIGSWTQTDVTYTVEHYIQMLNGDNQVVYQNVTDETESKTAKVDTPVTDELIQSLVKNNLTATDEPDGYVYSFEYEKYETAELGVNGVIIDGSVIRLYYDRVLKTSVFNDGKLVTAEDSTTDEDNEIRQGHIKVVTHYVGGSRHDDYEDVVNFVYNKSNMVDLKISVKDDAEYRLYAINAVLNEGNGWNYQGNSVLDNVVGGSTVDIYLVPVYTVEYYKVDGGTPVPYEQDEGTYTNVSGITGSVWTDAALKTQFTTIDLPAETGYTYKGWYTDSNLTGTEVDPNTSKNVADYVNFAENRVIKFYAGHKTATKYQYTINYYWVANKDVPGAQPIETTLSTGTFGETIKAADIAKTFEGYTQLPDEEQTDQITITENPDNNVINVYYYKNVTLKADSASHVYDGTEKTVDTYKVLDASSGSELDDVTFADLSAKGTGKLVGEYPVEFYENDAKVENAATLNSTLDDKQQYYVVAAEEGKLTITDTGDGFNPEDVVKKTHDNRTYGLGDTVTFTITVTNIYNEQKSLSIKEGLNVTYKSVDSSAGINYGATIPETLAAGETITIIAEYVVTEENITSGKLVNTVTVTLGDESFKDEDEVDLEDAEAELTVTKKVVEEDGFRPTGENGAYKLGETIKYKIVVTNTGNQTLTDINVKDEMTHDSVDGNTLTGGVLLDENDGPSNGVIEKLVPKGQEGKSSATFYYTYTVKESDLGKTLVNVATATSGDTEGKNDPEVVQTEDLKPSLSVSKEASRTSAKVGEIINYTITVTNDGNQTLNDIQVIDPLTGLEQTIAKLEPDETSEAIPTTYTVQVSDLVKGKVTNIATATAGSVTAEANETVVITGSLNISVTLNSDEFTYDGQEHTVSGIESVTYGNDVISVNNATFEIGDTTFTLSCAENTATATGTNVVRNPDGTVGSYPVTAQPTDITVKMGGQNVTGKVTVTNVIAGSLQINPRKVTITVQDAEKTYGESDPTPFQAVLSGDPLVNDTDLGTITCSRTNKDEDAGVYEDVLTAACETNENYDVIVVNGDFTIKKYTLPVAVTIEGTSAEKPYTGSEQSVEGYMITGITVNGVESELYPEASVQFVGEPYDKVASGTYVGEYSMALNKDDFENGNANFTNVTFQVTPGKLTITPGTYQPVTKTHEKKQDGSDLFALNETVTFPITVVNIYNTPAKVTLKEQEGVFFEGGSQTAEQVLGPGDKMIFNAYYVITEQDILNESFTNTVEWTIARIDDSEKITGTAADTVEVVAKAPKLTVSKAVKNSGDAPFDLDETITYTITVKNDGNVTVTGINVADLVTTEGENRQAATVNAEAFALKPGEDKSFEYTYKVQQSDLGKTILNTATATGSDPTGEEVVGTDDVEAETEERNPELDVTKVASKPANGAEFVLDETITYTITVKNTGNVTLADIFVSDEFSRDDGATWDVQKDKLTPSASTPITLEPGEQKIYTYQYTVVEEDLGKTLKNTATATAPNPDDPSQSVTDGATTPGEKVEDPKPDLSVTKEVVKEQTSYRVGDVITYQITVKNTGNTTIHNIKLTDVMQASGDVKFTSLDGGKLENGVPMRDSLAPKTAWVVTCQYTVQLADADSDGTTISNKVTVNAEDGPDGKDPETQTPGEDIDPIYTVVIKYQNGAGRDLHDPAVVKVHDGQKYSVDSPNVPGYHLTKANEKTVSGTLDATNPYISEEGVLTLVVVYARNPVEDDDDDPVVNPDNDPDETTEETEDEVDPGVYIEDPDDYTLTPITEEKTPLADLDVGDHTCCIMHFLLMLAAMVVLGFYTDSKKKHQARIFELKRTLAMEKGKNPDEDNSQQS